MSPAHFPDFVSGPNSGVTGEISRIGLDSGAKACYTDDNPQSITKGADISMTPINFVVYLGAVVVADQGRSLPISG
jgi:hypothetical protein